MLRSRTLVIVGLLGALVLLLGGVGVAYANANVNAQAPQPPADGWPFHGRGCFSGGGMFGPGGDLAGRGRVRGAYSLVAVTADVTGLTAEEVVLALEEGQTIAEIAQGKGVEPQGIVDAAVAQHRTRLQAAVDAGRLTDARMEEMLAEFEEHVTARLDEIHAPGLLSRERLGGALVGRFGGGSWTRAFDAVAEALGLDPTALFARLHDGESVAEVAEDAGVDLEAVQDAIRGARVEERMQAIEEAMEDGRLSGEQGQWLLEGLEEGYAPGGRGFMPGRNCGPERRIAPMRGRRNGGRSW